MIRLLNQQTIKKVIVFESHLLVDYKSKKLSIPLNQISKIEGSVNYYLNKSLDRSLTYSIKLKKKYRFGNTLFFGFKYGSFPFQDPQEIKLLREEMVK